MKRLVLFAMTMLMLAGTALAQGIQTGTIRGIVKDQQDLRRSRRDHHRRLARLAQGAAHDGHRRPGHLCHCRRCRRGTYDVTFELSGFATLKRTVDVPLGLSSSRRDACARPASSRRCRSSGRAAGADRDPGRRPATSSTTRSRRWRRRARCRASRRSRRADREHAQRRAAGDQRRVRVRQRVHDQRRRRQRQPVRLSRRTCSSRTRSRRRRCSPRASRAEYGRFSGGVVNAITKSGGNMFSGSSRVNLPNPSWTTETPFEVVEVRASQHRPAAAESRRRPSADRSSEDRLWFFTPGRYAELVDARDASIRPAFRSRPARQQQARRDQADRHAWRRITRSRAAI